MIDVIIPAYNAHETIFNTLYSIAIQKNSENLNVYIVNDCSNKDYKEVVDFFKQFIKIKELKLKKNSGPGVARQYGLEHSNSEYIIFIDSDDILSTPFSLSILKEQIEKENCDFVIGKFEHEMKNSNVVINNDLMFLHGKIYRRSFIKKHNIKFPNLYIEEDNSFNNLMILFDPKIVYINDSVYIYKYSENSITENNNIDLLKSYTEAMMYSLQEGIKNNANKCNIAALAYTTLIMNYYSIKSLLDNYENYLLLRKVYNIYEKYEKKLTVDDKIGILKYNIGRLNNNIFYDVITNQTITFKDFFNILKGGM